ncbi:M20 family metallopeptidase [[Mycoplasma] falconis]|uniref:M20 family metallopeptidase n=1 Tax=[Mycoplasma] falconis TaxID=92403 RepID=A0A501X7Z5_9BACT|nr:M20 family metallopeptidase [[Mycoplasma] falconis]
MPEFIKYKQSRKDFKQMIQDIANICAIPSISEEETASEYKFGENTHKALTYALDLAKSFGFETYIAPNSAYGYAQIGKGDKMIGILAHLDVVPAGDESQWKTSAFEPVITDKAIIARGSLDDKGPAIINLYAMKYIFDNNLLKKGWAIRIVFGLSEETNMKSMKQYLVDFGSPYISYTPDGEWPLIYAEKMVYHVELKFPKIPSLYIEGGEVVNQIPDLAIFKYEDKMMNIKGKGGHGSTPHKGENAIIKTIKALAKVNPELNKHALFRFINKNLSKKDFALKNIFGDISDFSGDLTANLGMIRSNANYHSLFFDLRVPVTNTLKGITDQLNNYLANNFEGKVEMKLIGHKDSKYIDPKDNLVKILMQTYREATNEDIKPLAIGGGTYARLVDNCVAYGSTKYMHLMHGPNEYFTFKEIKSSLEIYINALFRLQSYKPKK